MTDTDTRLTELESSLALVTARLDRLASPTPLAAVPPITIGELTDVPAPGSPIASQWAQEVSSRIVHRFATVAARDAAWPAATAGNGAVCEVLANDKTGGFYEVHAGAWNRPWNAPWGEVGTAIHNVSQNNISAEADIAGLFLTFTPVAGRRHLITCNFRMFMNGAGVVDCKIADVTNAQLQSQNFTASGAGFVGLFLHLVKTSVAASTTYKARVIATTSTANTSVGGNGPMMLVVTDIGPA